MVNIDSVNSFQAEWTTPWTEIQVFHKNRVRICQDPLPSFEPMCFQKGVLLGSISSPCEGQAGGWWGATVGGNQKSGVI